MMCKCGWMERKSLLDVNLQPDLMSILSDIRNLEQIIEDTKQAIIYWQEDPTYVDWLRNELSKAYAKLNKLEQSTCQ